MKRGARVAMAWWLALVVISGCGTQRSESTSSGAPAASEPAASATPAAHGDTAGAIVPADNVKDLLDQIVVNRAALAKLVQSGELERVHHYAYGLRDLVVALAARTTAIPTAQRIDLNSMVNRVKETATLLDQRGDAGDLTGTREELQRMNGLLDGIVALVPATSAP